MRLAYTVASGLVWALALAILLPVPSAQAHVSFGYQWQDTEGGVLCGGTPSPLGWMFVPEPCVVSYKLATSITNRSGWGNTARAAAASYSGFTDPDRGEIRFRYRDRTGTNRSEQVLAKAQNLGGPDAHGAITLGRAWWWYDCMSYCKLSYAELAATTNSNVTWNVNAGSSYTVPAGSYDLQSILAHEFGHTAGGRHPTCGPRSTHNMQAFFEAGERRLPGTHDRNMILYMYAGHNDAKYGPRVAPVTC